VHTGHVQELLQLDLDGDSGLLRIGAAVSYSQAWQAVTRLYPALAPLLERLGGLQVRNSGTIGGNIANGSPIGDMPPALIALGARLLLTSAEGQRELPCEDYFIAYGQQALQPGEFLQAILLPAPPAGLLFRSYKVSKRFEQDISALCGAFALQLDDGVVSSARVVFGGMAGTPLRAPTCEAALTGQPWTESTVRAAMAALQHDYQPIDDHRASATYRRQVAANLLLRCYLESSANAGATLPAKYDDHHVPA
jgi:xanthine dehydrogenase small subunit